MCLKVFEWLLLEVRSYWADNVPHRTLEDVVDVAAKGTRLKADVEARETAMREAMEARDLKAYVAAGRKRDAAVAKLARCEIEANAIHKQLMTQRLLGLGDMDD